MVGGGAFPTLAEAAAAVQPGDTIRLGRGQFGCAVLRGDAIRLEGSGAAATVLSGPVCQGKALLVIAGRNITVSALTLRGARAPDGNGAGIRLESGSLTVDAVRFVDNEDGILTIARDPAMTLIVLRSRFERNGSCAQDCAHGIYAGHIALVRVENSVFRATREGHHIKSRAVRTEISGCTIADGPDGTASYLVDLPDGGDAVLENNRLEKGPRASNTAAAISAAEESGSAHMVVVRNRFENGPRRGVLLRGAPGAVQKDNAQVFGP